MKNYKVTNRGKILITIYFIAIIGSYFFSALIFYSLSGLLVILLGIETINYIMDSLNNKPSRSREESNEDKVDVKIKAEFLEKAIIIEDESEEKKQEATEITNKKSRKNASNMINEGPYLEKNEENYEKIVDDFESIEEDIQSMEKDLEEIGKKAADLHKPFIESYYEEKKRKISTNMPTDIDEEKNQVFENFEEESLIDTFMERLKEFFSFRKYKKGNLVLHNHFGIGKIIDTDETLKVSFINDQLEEIIEFEYDKNKKIPELDLFKAPKGEDERQYYYNYKRDISEELMSTIEKIDLNLPDIQYQWNVFLKSGNAFEKYDFIAISDQIHVFSMASKDKIQCQLLKDYLEAFDLEIKKHEISDYASINSILLKSKIKGIMPLEVMHAVNQKIADGNIKDFNERMQYSEKLKDL